MPGFPVNGHSYTSTLLVAAVCFLFFVVVVLLFFAVVIFIQNVSRVPILITVILSFLDTIGQNILRSI